MIRLVDTRLRLIALATAVAVVAGGAASQAAHRGHKSPCSLRGSFTLYEDTLVRVYVKDHGVDGLDQDAYACRLSTNRRRKIASIIDRFGGPSVDLIRVQGSFLAYSLAGGSHGGDTGSAGAAAVLRGLPLSAALGERLASSLAATLGRPCAVRNAARDCPSMNFMA